MKEILRKYRNFGNSPRKKKQDLNEIPKEIKTNSQKTRLNQDIFKRPRLSCHSVYFWQMSP